MKRALRKEAVSVWYFVDGKRIDGKPTNISGNLSNIRGDLSGVSGNLSNIWGNLSGVSGDLSGVSGNLSDCDISEEERKAGINVADLIEE